MTHSPFSEGLAGLEAKRILGGLNYYFGRRGQRFKGSGERLSLLLADIEAQGVDHALCTGDLTSMSFRAEFEAAARIFGARATAPARTTVLPGNHDRYVASAAGLFEASFGGVAPPRYPFEKPIAPGVVIVLVDVARPAGLFDSSGLCGAEQRQALAELLRRERPPEEFVIVALHYGLLRHTGRRDRARHGIRDDVALLELLDAPESRVDLVLHGHMHTAYQVRSQRCAIGCAGSGTDLGHAAGYDLYEIEPVGRRFTVQRRSFDRALGRYVAR